MNSGRFTVPTHKGGTDVSPLDRLFDSRKPEPQQQKLSGDEQQGQRQFTTLTVDVEDWFHILDDAAVPDLEYWACLESRVEPNLDRMLNLLDSFSVKATFFWLGWVAERHTSLLRRCLDAGHEIASHGYAHVLPYKVGPKVFREDIVHARALLEDITGAPVRGFRAGGFGITSQAPWAFRIIKEAGYEYDSSVFPASRGHGGIADTPAGPYFVGTRAGHLLEIPISTVGLLGRRLCLFGGGYLRLANKRMIKWGLGRLAAAEQPLVVYVHPREVDPDQPRLPLPLARRFKCYVGLRSTLDKLHWLCANHSFCTMMQMIEQYVKSFYYERKTVPVVRFEGVDPATELSSDLPARTSAGSRRALREKLWEVETAMANFLGPVPASPTATTHRPMQTGRAQVL